MSPKKPIILYVLTEDWSLFTHRIDLARRAQKAGFHVVIACRIGHYGEKIRKEGFDLYPLKNLKRGGMNPLKDMRVLYELYKLYEKIRPDIVHHVALKPSLYGTLAARFARIHGIVNALGGLGYIFMESSLKVKIIRKSILFIFKFLFKAKNVRLILQNSDDVAVFKNIINSDQIILIRGSGVDLNQFYPIKHVRALPVSILMIGRLLWDKGVGDLVKAAQILKERNVPVRIQIVGDSDGENPSSIAGHVLEKWKKETNIEFLGRRDDIINLLHQADIAVLPSYREGLPKALLEAAACGLPLVATDVPGCREIVVNEVNGFLTPSKNPEKLAEALEKLGRDKKLRKKMGQKSLQLVQMQFSEEKINNEILEVYRELLV